MDSNVRRRHGSEQERGAVLLISIAILVLLSLFATAFVRLVNFERRASTNYTDAVRARLLAKAGIENALVRLKDVVDDHHYLVPEGAWAYGLRAPQGKESILTNLVMPLDLVTTTRPSFLLDPEAFKERFGEYRYLGDHLAVSGVLGQTYTDGLDVFKLKILDAASQLNLNHPDRAAAKRMLKYLLYEASLLEGSKWGLSKGQAAAIANAVIDARPDLGFQSKAEIEQLITSHIGRDRWLYAYKDRPAIRDMVTVYSWNDEKVIRPWNLNRTDPQRGLELMPRAPVNLNSAPMPVLVALLAELKAENDYGVFHLGYNEARLLASKIVDDRRSVPFKSWPQFESWLDAYEGFNSVKEVAPKAAEPSNPDQTWFDPRGIDEEGQAQRALVPEAVFRDVSPTWLAFAEGQQFRDLVKAMLNPNTMLTKFGAGANHGGSVLRGTGFPMPRLVDKADLIQISTEGCFDSGGVFEITSLGMLVQRRKEGGLVAGENEVAVIAAHTIQVVSRIYDVVRLTSQADFENHRALMAPGDFIPDTRAWKTYAGYNRQEFLDHPGWPGMISHPVYSLSRRSGEEHHAIRSEYAPALYDGHVTLSNLLGVQAEVHDFVVGFARGSINAFKVRAWWDPKDHDPKTGIPINRKGPSHPFGATPRRSQDLSANAIVGRQDSETLPLTEEQWYAGQGSVYGDKWPYVPDWTELDMLAGASYERDPELRRGPAPHVVGVKSGVADPLDASKGEPPVDASGRPFWQDGASLWNNGVALGPHRNLDADGNPAVLVYDANNLNLNVGHSLQFWVQPLADPYLQEVEILYSFIGSQTGAKRETGYRLFKRVDGVSGISIVLQAVPSSKIKNGSVPNPNPSNLGMTGADGVRYVWNTNDGQGGMWFSQTSIDVTPRIAGEGGAPSPLAGQPIDPFNPEWLPNSWHWLVINYGYTNLTIAGMPEVDISLQVDMTPTQPPKGVPADAAEGAAGRIPFRGQAVLSPGGTYPEAYGQIHGIDTTRQVGHGHPIRDLPLGWATSIHRHTGPDSEGHGTYRGSPASGPFGEEYQEPVDTGDLHTGEHTEPGEVRAGWIPPSPKVGADRTTEIILHWHWNVFAWVTPRLLGDFYHCGLDPGSEMTVKRVRHEERHQGAITYSGGKYSVGNVSFPPGVYGQQLFCVFVDESGKTIDHFYLDKDDGDGKKKPVRYNLGHYQGQVPFLFNKSGNWQLTLGSGGRLGEFGRDLTPGGKHEWRLDVIKRWTTYELEGGCDCCTAAQGSADSPWPNQWDGAYARLKERFPTEHTKKDGCFHDSENMKLYESIKPARGGTRSSPEADPPYACKMVIHSALKGVTSNIGTLPLISTIPAEGVCDDCHGCEACDVDGPMWFGGEPAGSRNFIDDECTQLAPVNKETVARAVFDNIVVRNSLRYRTDFPGIETSPGIVTAMPEWYQDRFFTGQLAEDYVSASAQRGGLDDQSNTIGYGAVFRRGLLELIGTRGRLASVSWTVYPSTPASPSSRPPLSLEPRLWHLRGRNAVGKPVWRSDNAGLLTGPRASFPGAWRGSDCELHDEQPIGLVFPGGLTYNGVDTGAGPEILILGFQLKDMFNVDTKGEDTTLVGRQTVASDGGKYDFKGSGLPTPMYQTPVLEDVTVNVIRETAQTLYAEEGVAE